MLCGETGRADAGPEGRADFAQRMLGLKPQPPSAQSLSGADEVVPFQDGHRWHPTHFARPRQTKWMGHPGNCKFFVGPVAVGREGSSPRGLKPASLLCC